MVQTKPHCSVKSVATTNSRPPTGEGPVFSHRGSFLVKNTEARFHKSRHLSLHQGVHSPDCPQDRGAALTLTTHHSAKEEDTESLEGEMSAQSHPDSTSSRSQSQLQDQPVRRCQCADWGLYRRPPTSSLLRANSGTFHHFRHYRRLHLPLSEAQTPMSF